MRFCWHKWSKWEDDSTAKGSAPGVQSPKFTIEWLIQVKKCLKCNKKKYRREQIC